VPDNSKRPDAPLVHANDVEHRRKIAIRANAGLPYDGSRAMNAPLVLKEYAVSTLPSASLWTGGFIYVSDESGGAQPAFSDGTNWRRFTDRSVVS
jgi:hypothetical protein